MFTSNFEVLNLLLQISRFPAHKTQMPPGKGITPGGTNREISALLPKA
jgi:hypothetical protein